MHEIQSKFLSNSELIRTVSKSEDHQSIGPIWIRKWGSRESQEGRRMVKESKPNYWNLVRPDNLDGTIFKTFDRLEVKVHTSSSPKVATSWLNTSKV